MKLFDVYERVEKGVRRWLGEVNGDDAEDALDTAHILASGERHGRLFVVPRQTQKQREELNA